MEQIKQLLLTSFSSKLYQFQVPGKGKMRGPLPSILRSDHHGKLVYANPLHEIGTSVPIIQ